MRNYVVADGEKDIPDEIRIVGLGDGGFFPPRKDILVDGEQFPLHVLRDYEVETKDGWPGYEFLTVTLVARKVVDETEELALFAAHEGLVNIAADDDRVELLSG